MLLNAFPDIDWLKQQISTGFSNRRAYNGAQLESDGWPTVILNTQGKVCERNDIQGPFSFFTNLEGSSSVSSVGRSLKVDRGFFVLTNPGDVYSLRITQANTTETFNLHYGQKDYNDMLAALVQKEIKLLDNWESQPTMPLRFPFHSIPLDSSLSMLIRQLKMKYQQSNVASSEKDELLFKLVVMVLKKTQKQFNAPFPSGPKKRSVKLELIDRLFCARDFMHDNYHQALSLEQIAQQAFLSKYHFLRLFHAYFGITPTQYLQKLRVNKAQRLLATKNYSMEQIAHQVGYAYANTLAKLLRVEAGNKAGFTANRKN